MKVLCRLVSILCEPFVQLGSIEQPLFTLVWLRMIRNFSSRDKLIEGGSRKTYVIRGF